MVYLRVNLYRFTGLHPDSQKESPTTLPHAGNDGLDSMEAPVLPSVLGEGQVQELLKHFGGLQWVLDGLIIHVRLAAHN